MSQEQLIRFAIEEYTNIIIPSISAAIIIVDLFVLIKGRQIVKGSVAYYCKLQAVFVFLHSIFFVKIGQNGLFLLILNSKSSGAVWR